MSKGKYSKRTNVGRIFYWLALIFLTAVFVASFWYLADYFLGSRKQAQGFEDLASMVEAARGTTPTVSKDTPEEEASQDPDSPDLSRLPEGVPALPEDARDENGILLEYAALHEMNPDMAGWITIPDTRINYPVMHTPGQPDRYLKRSFDGEYSDWGCLYAREECSLTEPSDNVTIYGHNMKDGSMFAGLLAYEKKSYWQDHRYIQFDTLTEHHVYEIFVVFKTTATLGQGFSYHDFIDAGDAIAFDTFLAKCFSNSLYDTGITPVYGDKLICLSTCEYSQENGRLVVAARRIR